jgi:hypothetical protein
MELHELDLSILGLRNDPAVHGFAISSKLITAFDLAVVFYSTIRVGALQADPESKMWRDFSMCGCVGTLF